MKGQFMDDEIQDNKDIKRQLKFLNSLLIEEIKYVNVENFT